MTSLLDSSAQNRNLELLYLLQASLQVVVSTALNMAFLMMYLSGKERICGRW
ncbi:unnamed protein product [Rhodiola kirilowii]